MVVTVVFAGEVKAQLSSLKGRNKLALLQQQLKSIQENAKSAEQVSCSCSCSWVDSQIYIPCPVLKIFSKCNFQTQIFIFFE